MTSRVRRDLQKQSLLSQTATKTLTRAAIVIMLGITLLLIRGNSAQAQSNKKGQRRQHIEELIQALIESEQERHESNTAEQGQAPAARHNGQPTRQLLQARPILKRFSQEAVGLTRDLDQDLDTNAGIRPIFGTVLKLRARSFVLSKKSDDAVDHRLISEEFQLLDNDWQVLAYRLRLIRGLNAASIEHMKQLDALDRELARIFRVNGRFDRDELNRQLTSMMVDLDNLLQDLDLELQPSPTRDQLMISGRKLHQHVDHLSKAVVEGVEYERVASGYRQFRGEWYSCAGSLRALENRLIERGVRRIAETDRQLHVLLHLPKRIDREQLLHLTATLMKDVDTFYARASLKLLVMLPKDSNVIPTCDQFYDVCSNFAEAVNEGVDHGELIEDFRYVEDGWAEFHSLFSQLKSRKAHVVLKEVENGISALRQSLQLREGFDREEGARLAAALENLTEHLDLDIRHWLDESPANFKQQAQQDSKALRQAAREFHEHLANGAELTQLYHESTKISTRWQHLHEYVKLCNTEDRGHLLRVSAKITPVVVELQTRLEQ